jgi:glycosyltransferase involved in cell wall biosynthesis
LCAKLASHFGNNLELVVVQTDTTSAPRPAAEKPIKYLAPASSIGHEAGKLRNHAALHAGGEYVFFLDDDDSIDSGALAAALERTCEAGWDSAVFPYRLVTSSKKPPANPMTEHDCKIWSRIDPGLPTKDFRNQLLRLGNYPWIRLTKTSFIRQHNLQFGSTAVHNDIRFHWHSLVAAESLGICPGPVCTHFLHEGGSQLTSITDERRLQVFDALAETYAVISTYPRYTEIRETWINFCREIIAWARDNTEKRHLSAFKNRMRIFNPEPWPKAPKRDRLTKLANLLGMKGHWTRGRA